MAAGFPVTSTLRYLGLVAGALLLGCAGPRRSDWYRSLAPAPPALEAEWAQYHWYVVDVRYAFNTRLSWEGMHRATLSYTDLYLVVKALTQEGSQIGTLNIPYWNQSLQSIDAVLLDSAGRQVPVDAEKIRKTYAAKGVVLLPRVTRGSMVAVHIRQGPFTVLDYWEYPMAGPVPAYRSTFEFTYPRSLEYRFKEYNGLGAPVQRRKGREIRRVWTAGNILPVPDIPFLDVTSARPRLVITRADRVGGYPDWKAVADRRNKEFFGRTHLDNHAKTQKQAGEIVAQLAVSKALAAKSAGALPAADQVPEDWDKAASLLEWVQDNIGEDDDAPALQDPDKTLELRRGNMWQLAALTKEMFSAAGLKSRIVLSRDREQGGMDAAMVAPDAAWEPLVLVTAKGREWAACPHLRAYGLGDYPPEFAGLPALSLEDGVTCKLPEPAHAEALMIETQELSLDNARERHLSLELSGPFAWLARDRFFDAQDRGRGDTLDFCRDFLRAEGFGGNPRACSVRGLDRRNRPLKLELAFDPLGPSVDRAGGRQWSLPDPFSRPAWFYDRARDEDYHFAFDQIRRQTLLVAKPAGRRLDLDVPCRDGEHAALKVACQRKEEDGRMLVTRETVIKKGHYPAALLRKDQDAFTELDQAGEARATERRN